LIRNSNKSRAFFWLRIRQISQALFLVLFLFLFIKTDYTGTDELKYAVNIFFRLNPLLATCAIFAGKAFITLFFPALIVIVLTIIFGRFFCGWFCPMGTLLDYTNRFWRKRRLKKTYKPFTLKYILLVVIITGAFFGLPIAGYFDPFSLLVRSMALSIFPAFNNAASSFFGMTYKFGPDWLNTVTEPVYSFMKDNILPFEQKQYNLSLMSLGLIISVFYLEKFGRRFFCNYICPLGAFLSIPARFAFFKGFSHGNDCKKCRACRSICRMEAINDQKQIAPDKCNLCLDCVVACPNNYISFTFKQIEKKPEFNFLSRRLFAGSLIAGVFTPFFLNTGVLAKKSNPLLIRPPGALLEKDFLGVCVRCGECMKVCITNALQPVFLEAGIEGVFTPKLVSRIGYCEYNCSLCGQVCPSGAIKDLPLKEKKKVIIGRAEFDKNRCLPFVKGIPCIVCEEHCPTPSKAIKFRTKIVKNMNNENVPVRQPYIVDELCIGCGICENKCPLPGKAAVIVFSDGQSREITNTFYG
jgi:polyferredoxin/Pyruvate/2-oxoacid:ferredoxin oxidoreductase delta subunit